MPSLNPGCTLCPLYENAHTVCVSGEWRGDPEWRGPTVMVVGQSPGRQEDYEGHPFIGPSGRELEEALRQASIGRYYVTNAAKCSPEVNGLEIDMAHVRACADYLEQEIEVVRPNWVLALGNPAVQRLIGKGKVSEVAGKEIWANRYQAWVVPAWHPAAILRNQGRRSSWLADISRFGLLVRGKIKPPPRVPPVRVDLVDTGRGLEGLSRLLLTEPEFTYDFEANTLPWWHRGYRPYSIAFSFTGAEAYAVPLEHPDVDAPRWIKLTRNWLTNLARRVFVAPSRDNQTRHGAWNDVYDGLVLYRLTGVMPYIYWDAMVAAHLLDENAPKSLKWNGRAHLSWPDWDINAAKYHPFAELYPYNGYDAACTSLMLELQREKFRSEPRLYQYFHAVDMPKVRFTQRVVANGIHVDRAYAARGLWQARARRNAADDRLFMESLGLVKNPQSADQMARWLYDELRLHEKIGGKPIRNGKKHLTTDEETINRLALKFPEVRHVLDCRRPRKEISTYYRPVGRASRESFDRRYHADVRTTSVETGRKGSGFHTIPRPEESKSRGELPVRPVFGAPPGAALVAADYRQLEARLAAWSAAGKPERLEDVRPGTMLWDFLCDVDVYRKFASQPLVLNKPIDRIDKDERQRMGKVPVLALLYTISPKGLQEYAWKYYEIDWSLNQAARIHTAFHRLYPEFPYWHHLEEAKLRHRGFASSAVGRVRRLPGAQAGVPDDIRAGINAPVQSLASDITQKAGDIIQAAIDKHGLPYLLVGDIHDSILAEAPGARAGDCADLVRTGMLLAPERLRSLGLRLVPGLIDVEVSIGPWGAGREVKFDTRGDSALTA